METDGAHEVVCHAQDEAPHKRRHALGVDIAAQGGVREVRIASDCRRDEFTTSHNFPRQLQMSDIERVIRRLLERAQHEHDDTTRSGRRLERAHHEHEDTTRSGRRLERAHHEHEDTTRNNRRLERAHQERKNITRRRYRRVVSS